MNTTTHWKKEGGKVMEGEKEIGNFITNYYRSLFMSSVGNVNDDLLQYVPHSMKDGMTESLALLFTIEEVKDGLDSIGDLKSPGLVMGITTWVGQRQNDLPASLPGIRTTTDQ
jgi:hypothetical protein